MTRVVLDAIAKSEQRLFDAIAKSEVGIHGELTGIRQELAKSEVGIHGELAGIRQELAKSEAGIHGELASIRQELGEVGRSVKLLVERFFSPSEQRDLRRAG
jgi:hypothetical protein